MDMVGVFLELTDEQLDTIKADSAYHQDKSLIKDLISSKGDNAHFFGFFNNSKSVLIHKNLDLLFKDYKSVSWWDSDLGEFIIRWRTNG